MLGQRKPHNLLLTLANSMNDVVAEILARDYPEIMHHQEGFDFVPGTAVCPLWSKGWHKDSSHRES